MNKLAPFQDMEPRQINEVLNLARRQVLDRGTEVFREGQDADRFFLLLDGHVRVGRLAADGTQVTALFIPPGELFGFAAALGRTTYPATAETASDALVLAWPMSLWTRFAEEFPSFARVTQQTVGQRFYEMNNRLIEMATQQAQQRIAGSLVRLAEQFEPQADRDEGIEIAFPVTRQHIAEMSGTTLHTASRVLAAWEQADIVSGRRTQIRVHDLDRLRALSEQPMVAE